MTLLGIASPLWSFVQHSYSHVIQILLFQIKTIWMMAIPKDFYNWKVSPVHAKVDEAIYLQTHKVHKYASKFPLFFRDKKNQSNPIYFVWDQTQ